MVGLRKASIWLVCGLLGLAQCAVATAGERCPTTSDEIATDRPDITNSSRNAPAYVLGVGYSFRIDGLF